MRLTTSLLNPIPASDSRLKTPRRQLGQHDFSRGAHGVAWHGEAATQVPTGIGHACMQMHAVRAQDTRQRDELQRLIPHRALRFSRITQHGARQTADGGSDAGGPAARVAAGKLRCVREASIPARTGRNKFKFGCKKYRWRIAGKCNQLLNSQHHVKNEKKPQAVTSRKCVISDGAPNRLGGPQYPVPRLV